MSINAPTLPVTPTVPDHLPDDLVSATLAAWPRPAEADLIYVRRGALLGVPATSAVWVASRLADLRPHAVDWGELRSVTSGRFAQAISVGTGLVVELGGPGGHLAQVGRVGRRDDARLTRLDAVERRDGRRAVPRTGHGWSLRQVAAANAMWAWCAQGRVRAGLVIEDVL